AVAAVAFAVPALAAAGSCAPPPGADGWYCAAMALNSTDAIAGVKDRQVDDYFRDASSVSSKASSCTPPAGADGWYCAALALSNPSSSPAVAERLVDDYFRDA